jgi:hypothetical protein
MENEYFSLIHILMTYFIQTRLLTVFFETIKQNTLSICISVKSLSEQVDLHTQNKIFVLLGN